MTATAPDATNRNVQAPTSSWGDRILRGVLGAVAAGAVFIALNVWFASSVGNPPQGPLSMISTIVLGEDAMASGAANPALGAAIHLVLSVVYGVLFALVAPFLTSNGARAVAGTAYGALLYVMNFLVISPMVLPIFGNANQPFEFAAHVVFGTVLSFAFYRRSAGHPELRPRPA